LKSETALLGYKRWLKIGCDRRRYTAEHRRSLEQLSKDDADEESGQSKQNYLDYGQAAVLVSQVVRIGIQLVLKLDGISLV
jgi:hypothetical protein